MTTKESIVTTIVDEVWRHNVPNGPYRAKLLGKERDCHGK